MHSPEACHFICRIHATSARASVSDRPALGGMGMGPHTPLPPFFTFCTSLSVAPLSLAYLVAISLKAGPTTLVFLEWQAMQLLLVARAS